MGVTIIKLQHVFLSPLVMLAVPPLALLDQNILFTVGVALVGLAGMLLGKRTLATVASLSLLTLLIWGKAATSILKTSPPDTAVLLVEFTMVLMFMEASFLTLTFNRDYSQLKAREDELSQVLRVRLRGWLRNQLTGQSKLALVAFGLSVGLLPIAGFTSISSNQLAFSATLALLAVVVLLFLITHRREPEGS